MLLMHYSTKCWPLSYDWTDAFGGMSLLWSYLWLCLTHSFKLSSDEHHMHRLICGVIAIWLIQVSGMTFSMEVNLRAIIVDRKI